jgi:hypothetical protein
VQVRFSSHDFLSCGSAKSALTAVVANYDPGTHADQAVCGVTYDNINRANRHAGKMQEVQLCGLGKAVSPRFSVKGYAAIVALIKYRNCLCVHGVFLY